MARKPRLSPTLMQMAAEFDLALEAENKAPRTREAYRESLRMLERLLVEQGRPVRVAEIRTEDLRAFMADQLARLKPASAHHRYRALRRFFRWCVAEGELSVSPMDPIGAPIVPESEVPVLTEDQLRRLFKTCDGASFEARRDAALLSLLVDTGLRRSEVAGLRLGDVDFEYRTVTVLGKGRRPRTVPFGARTARALVRWLRERDAHDLASTPWLWLGTSGRQLQSRGVQQVVERRGAQAGVRVHAHMFRHTFAHVHLASGGHEGDLMMLTGWRSRQMLTRYAASTRSERARANYRSPVDNL